MSELINGRTPDEIKIGLRTCQSLGMILGGCGSCPYKGCDGDCDLGLEDDALALIEHLEAKIPHWISVDERLPESGVHVFVLCEIRANGGAVRRYVCDGFHVEAWKEKAGCYSEDCALVYNYEDDEYYLEEGWYEVIKNWEEYNSVTIADFVTHWMPLPEPPKEDA